MRNDKQTRKDETMEATETCVLEWATKSGSRGKLIYWQYSDGTESWSVEAFASDGQPGGRKELAENQAAALFAQCPIAGQTLIAKAVTIRGEDDGEEALKEVLGSLYRKDE